ncbi:MAG: hypothetical protein MUO52_08705, partial [Desulfobacterales bacterium]|nr:hypothetical protein [Desulfobacterales bacterium]
ALKFHGVKIQQAKEPRKMKHRTKAEPPVSRGTRSFKLQNIHTHPAQHMAFVLSQPFHSLVYTAVDVFLSALLTNPGRNTLNNDQRASPPIIDSNLFLVYSSFAEITLLERA